MPFSPPPGFDGMILHTQQLGAGQPLVLLHGLFGRARNFVHVARVLAARWTVLMMDSRNHGGSPHGAGMGYDVQAADVAETLTHLGFDKATVLGHSMGGKTAMALALLQPERISRLIVIDMAPIAYPHTAAQVVAAMLAIKLRPGLTRAEVDEALVKTVPQPGVRTHLLENLEFEPVPRWRAGLAEIAADVTGIRGWPEALQGRQWGGPARFVRAAQSLYIGPAGRAAILAAFPAAEFVSVPDSGHWVHVDAPAGFVAATGL